MQCKIIAEAGINHNGEIKLAHKMVDLARENGADIIKFQAHIADKEMVYDIADHVKIAPDIYKIIKNTSLNYDELLDLKKHSEDVGLEFLVTPFSLESIEWLEGMGVNSYKVGSGELLDFLLLNRLVSTGKKIIISTGMSHLKEIEEAVYFLKKNKVEFALMHCTSKYPCPFSDVRLYKIIEYQNKFKCAVGFSDHSPGINASIASVSLGANLIEKHFTLDKNLPGPDQAASITSEELNKLSIAVKEVSDCVTSNEKTICDMDDVRQLFMHGITARKNLKEGETITLNSITSKRPLIGIPTIYFEKVIGKKVNKEIKEDSQILWGDIYGDL